MTPRRSERASRTRSRRSSRTLGGTVTKRDGVESSTNPDYNAILTEAAQGNPEAIYFGGVTATGGARAQLAAADAGLDVPFVGPDGINDGNADTPDSFLNLAGDAAANSYSTLAGIGDFPGKADFDAAYEAEYGEAATPGYAATGYACAQVVLDAIDALAEAENADMAALRESVRAAAVDTSITYETVLGDVQFDENGDTNQLIISFYSVEAAERDWVFDQQIDFAEGS